MMSTLFECSYREIGGGSLPAAHIPCVAHGGLGKLLREGKLQAWLFLFPKHSMTATTARVTQPLRATKGTSQEQSVLHSSLDYDSRWQGFLLTHLAFYMLNT